MKMKRSETLQCAIGTAREEWGTGETARVQRHQAHVTAPREGTMELEKPKELTRERRARRETRPRIPQCDVRGDSKVEEGAGE